MALWNFPENGGGQIHGYADAGIETFSGNEIASLAREICQNSLDAADKPGIPVKVEFHQNNIVVDKMPGYNDFKKIVEKSRVYWGESHSAKAKGFLNDALSHLDPGHRVFVLRASDYNTTGLSDPYAKEGFGGWRSLTKIDGGAMKNGDSAGSFGIGKNAPFGNSFYRVVFYRTLNKKGERASQGMARLMSFPLDNQGKMTVGIGYYGNPVDNMPVESIPILENLNQRTETGTDVFIFGFKDNSATWEQNLIKEVLNSFLVAIYRKALQVVVQDSVLNKDSLQQYLNKYIKQVPDSYYDYLALTGTEKDGVHICEQEAMDGVFRLHVLVDPSRKLNRRILVVRKSGMKLFQMANISQQVSFTGVLEIEGLNLNEFFRDMETPSHEKWEPKKHRNPVLAAEWLRELRNWIKETVLSFDVVTDTETIEVKGVSSNLDAATNNVGDDISNEMMEDTVKNIIMVEEKPVKKSKGILAEYGDSITNKKDVKTRNSGKKVKGTITNDPNDDSAVRILGGKRDVPRKKREHHTGKQDNEGKDTINKTEKLVEVPLEHVRIIKASGESYQLVVRIPKTVENGHVELKAIGENGKVNVLPIQSAREMINCTNVRVEDKTKIVFGNMKRETTSKLSFSLTDDREYAMEVVIYEHR